MNDEPKRRSTDPVPGTKGPARSSPPGGTAMPVGGHKRETAEDKPAPPAKSSKLLQRALDDRMSKVEKFKHGGPVKAAAKKRR